MYMEYGEYFSNLYEKYKDTSKDAVEDKKHFKYDFYNLVLDSLQIKEDYEKHFTLKHSLSNEDLAFLNEFSSFIFSDSHSVNTKSEPESLTRGIGQKPERNNGRHIIKHQYTNFSRELFSIFQSFNKALAKDENNTFILEVNPIVSEITKMIAKDYISSISANLLKRIDSLPAAYFSCFMNNLSTDIINLIRSCINILKTLDDYSKCNFIIEPNDEDQQKKIQNSIINSMLGIGNIPLSQNEKNIIHKLNQMKDKSSYRNTKKEINKLQIELEDSIYNSNIKIFEQFKLNRSDFHYFVDKNEKLKADYYLAQLFYDIITDDFPDQLIKFHK